MYDQITAKFLQLTIPEQEQFFQMLKDHGPVLQKMLPQHPLIDHAVNNSGDNTDWAVAAYNAWLSQQGK